jgi:hypothetical protein
MVARECSGGVFYFMEDMEEREREREREGERETRDKILPSICPSDPLPPGKTHLLKFPEPPKTSNTSWGPGI